MKRIFITLTSLSILASCADAPQADQAQSGKAGIVNETGGTSYSLKTGSTIEWTGTKANGSHTGIFPVQKGSLILSGDQLQGGNLVIDVADLQNRDLVESPTDQGKLEGHLKSADFFDVEKYPTAKFEITDIKPFDTAGNVTVIKGATHWISGNLTLKDSTRNITFPARVTVQDSSIQAEANFNIDRTDWGMNYKGPNNPQDWFIRKEVNLHFDLQATR